MIENGVMLQYFHWHIPPDGRLWAELVRLAVRVASGVRPSLATHSITRAETFLARLNFSEVTAITAAIAPTHR